MKITREDLEDHGLPLVYQFRAAIAAGGGVRPFIELYIEEEWGEGFAPAIGRKLVDGLGIAFAAVIDEDLSGPRFLLSRAELDVWPALRGKASVSVADAVRFMVLEWLAWWYEDGDDYRRQNALARAWEKKGIPKALPPRKKRTRAA